MTPGRPPLFKMFLLLIVQLHFMGRQEVCVFKPWIASILVFSPPIIMPLCCYEMVQISWYASCSYSLLKVTLTLTHTSTHTYIHRQCGVYSLEKFGCPFVVESHSHARKVSAVSRSSISSAAVASILAREKSLIGRASTTCQVLFCGEMKAGKHKGNIIYHFCPTGKFLTPTTFINE